MLNYGNLSDSRKFSRTMVAIDDPQHSMDAADYGILIARKHGSELIIIHFLPVDSSVFGFQSSPRIDEIKKEAVENFDKILESRKNQ